MSSQYSFKVATVSIFQFKNCQHVIVTDLVDLKRELIGVPIILKPVSRFA